MSDTTEPSTEDMKAALIEAGRKIRSNASDETIRIEYLELQAELGADSEPEPEIAPEPAPVHVPASSGKETFEDIIKTADPLAGDKDPKIIAWCKKNLSEAEFEKRYSGRTFSRS